MKKENEKKQTAKEGMTWRQRTCPHSGVLLWLMKCENPSLGKKYALNAVCFNIPKMAESSRSLVFCLSEVLVSGVVFLSTEGKYAAAVTQSSTRSRVGFGLRPPSYPTPPLFSETQSASFPALLPCQKEWGCNWACGDRWSLFIVPAERCEVSWDF